MTAPDVAAAWVAGLAVARRSPRPVPVPWGLRVDVGRPKERVRHVILRGELDAVTAASASATAPNSWILAFLEPGPTLARLGDGWQHTGTEMLMVSEVTAVTAPSTGLPPGFELTCTTQGRVTRAEIRTADGRLVADGFAGVVQQHDRGIAVMDRVATDPEHRRLGLGTAVVLALTAAARGHGAQAGVLGATTEGQALYESLGWHAVAPLARFVRR